MNSRRCPTSSAASGEPGESGICADIVAAYADDAGTQSASSGERHQESGGDEDAEGFRLAVAEHRISVEASALAMRPLSKASDKPARVSKRRAGGSR